MLFENHDVESLWLIHFIGDKILFLNQLKNSILTEVTQTLVLQVNELEKSK